MSAPAVVPATVRPTAWPEVRPDSWGRALDLAAARRAVPLPRVGV